MRLQHRRWNLAKSHYLVGFVLAATRLHVPGAINLPHGRIVERNLAAFPAGVAFVVYCSGPHCTTI